MNTITTDLINDLIRSEGEPCVSIYLPTHRTGREQQQDPIRLKNLLAEARARLEDNGLRKPEIDELLAPAQDLLEDSRFWQHQDIGLAIFISPDLFEAHRLPVTFEARAVVGESFHLKPVLSLLGQQGDHFYILALSQNDIRLLHGDPYGIAEVDLEDVPTSLQEALWYEDPERQLQYHSGSTSPGGQKRRPSIYHGQGVPEEDDRTELLRYFQQVDRGIADMLQDRQDPLVLAGVDYLIPIYREASDYPHLVDEAITGSPEALADETLHRQAWGLVEPLFSRDLTDALERHAALSGAGDGLASSELAEIVPAAHHGRVEILLVVRDVQVWGTYDPDTATIDRHHEFQPGDRDLLDMAAVQTILNGGQVYVLEPSQMSEEEIAAVFRYEVAG